MTQQPGHTRTTTTHTHTRAQHALNKDQQKQKASTDEERQQKKEAPEASICSSGQEGRGVRPSARTEGVYGAAYLPTAGSTRRTPIPGSTCTLTRKVSSKGTLENTPGLNVLPCYLSTPGPSYGCPQGAFPPPWTAAAAHPLREEGQARCASYYLMCSLDI